MLSVYIFKMGHFKEFIYFQINIFYFFESKTRSIPPEVFLAKGFLKIYSKFTGEHPCQSVISIKLLRHECFPVNLLYFFRTPFPRNTSGGLLLADSIEGKILIGFYYENDLLPKLFVAYDIERCI